MNPLIIELYQQAHTTRSWDGDPTREGNPPTIYWDGEVSAHRFAHLIARETFDWIVENVGLMEDQEWQALCKDLGLVVEL